jgi:cysteine-rich repeat protein
MIARCAPFVVVVFLTACGAGDLDRTNPNDRANARCGNASLDPGEVCDDGNAIDDDNCRRDCTLAFCGDGVTRRDIEAGQPGFEECDDANTEGSDGCSAACLLEACGNGRVDPGEDCDDGNTDNDDRCTTACAPPACGDGFVQTGEVCDDSNTIDSDACRADCRAAARCGDGITRTDLNETQEGFEACDDGNIDEEDGCASTCRIQGCGDGITQSDEACDDGDQRDNNACRADCQAYARCGDGVRRVDLEPGHEGFEECDDGNRIDYDACTSDCARARCGDGVLRSDIDAGEADFEQCDDGNDEDTDDCLNRCTVAVCNDGVLQADSAEVCDDGNDDSADGCTVNCREHACMDGFLQDEEECDDGNGQNADGCTRACTVAVCGDGIHRRYGYDEEGVQIELSVEDEGFEPCEDGNEVNDDACLNACTIARCGDGVLRRDLAPENAELYEDCEDDNDESGDGCAGCRVEPVQLAAGHGHVCLRLADGRVSCAGRNHVGQLGNGQIGGHNLVFHPVADLESARTIAAGSHTSCAIKNDGTLWCWGTVALGGNVNQFQRRTPIRVGQHDNIEKVSISENRTICYITAEAQMFCVGDNDRQTLAGRRCWDTPCAVGPAGAFEVALGSRHTCLLLGDGRVFCWGYNREGNLGRNTTSTRDTPTPAEIYRASGFAAIGAGGGQRTCALHRAGTVYCWGAGGTDQGWLGNNQRVAYSDRPLAVYGLSEATQLAVGVSHACATRQNGSVWCWGSPLGYGEQDTSLRPRETTLAGGSGMAMESSVTFQLRDRRLFWLGRSEARQESNGELALQLTAWPH